MLLLELICFSVDLGGCDGSWPLLHLSSGKLGIINTTKSSQAAKRVDIFLRYSRQGMVACQKQLLT